MIFLNIILIAFFLFAVAGGVVSVLEFDVFDIFVCIIALAFIGNLIYQLNVNTSNFVKKSEIVVDEPPKKIGEIDGCAFYKFYDDGKFHYISNCDQKGN